MKVMVPKLVEIDVAFVRVTLPVRYGVEDIAMDFPLRRNDSWDAVIDIETGKIEEWPIGIAGEFDMKVCDEGVYELLDRNRERLDLIEDYVPDLIPGKWGDYVELKIDENGIITNWPKRLSLRGFFKQKDE